MGAHMQDIGLQTSAYTYKNHTALEFIAVEGEQGTSRKISLT